MIGLSAHGKYIKQVLSLCRISFTRLMCDARA